MLLRKTVHGILLAFTALGIAGAGVGGLFGPAPAGLALADAAPAQAWAEFENASGRSLEPLATEFSIEGKIAVEGAELPRTMSRAAIRAEAPLPKPVVVRTVSAASSSVSRSAASTSGWSTARVSWYGPGFYGQSTASGETLVEGMMNCAHRTLPFGTRVQFEYNGRTCTAVVNDRGPYVSSRTFDLGPGTAISLGFSGVGTVRYRVLGR